jgi:hypothetical protein
MRQSDMALPLWTLMPRFDQAHQPWNSNLKPAAMPASMLHEPSICPLSYLSFPVSRG